MLLADVLHVYFFGFKLVLSFGSKYDFARKKIFFNKKTRGLSPGIQTLFGPSNQ